MLVKMMKEKPILFKRPLVKAIRAKRKTQTRRLMRPMSKSYGREFTGWILPEHRTDCPYRPGTIAWVKETWRLWESESFTRGGEPLDPDVLTGSLKNYDEEFIKTRPIEYRADTDDDGPWRSSLFMPRWASRINLLILDSHPQLLHDINIDDAKAEGITEYGEFFEKEGDDEWRNRTSVENFAWLWDSINKKSGQSWSSNPYVWRITFELIE